MYAKLGNPAYKCKGSRHIVKIIRKSIYNFGALPTRLDGFLSLEYRLDEIRVRHFGNYADLSSNLLVLNHD